MPTPRTLAMNDPAAMDKAVRGEAIDPARSFVVQAPAGSGKTSLLTQRFLGLLATVERPEEIVAITFTRKAAAEMRHRIVAALTQAAGEPEPDASDHDRETWALARDALEHGHRLGWNLERHPSRLHIQTIDGLNHWLAGKLPLSARLGLTPRLLDDARPVYDETARRFVAQLEQDGPVAEAILRLARMLDYDPAWLESLFADMLGRREIWLPKLLELAASTDPRREMEGLLTAAVEAELARIRRALGGEIMQQVLALLGEADRLAPGGPLASLGSLEALPAATRDARGQWESLAAILLTRKGEARRTVNKNQGFPPQLKEQKTRMLELLERLAGAPGIVTGLAGVLDLPPLGYNEEQWARIEALRATLLPAAAELQATFGERGLLDHPAVAAAARQALGGPEAPSELAQALEYRIRHVLVDEYQDTSPAQQDLLQRLVEGWQPGDGHTLFCVGDPMQSIYGFREADVTLFLEAQSRGIGSVGLEPRALSRNFRSCRSVVEWVNETFARLMPGDADFARGAVPYTPSACTRADETGAGASLHALIGRDEGREARVLADIVVQTLAEHRRLEEAEAAAGLATEPRSIAILVRARATLPAILAELRARGIEYRGVELEKLGSRPAVRDLLALARALLHPGDRTAWLAVLRAPWCGLPLADLHALAFPDRKASVASLLADPAALDLLSGDGRRRAARTWAVLQRSLPEGGRRPLGSWVKACWLALGGPATLTERSDLENVEACLAALDKLADETCTLPSAAQIESAVDGLMASPVGAADASVQLMTIHKAKGLEFDTVILPGLERTVTGAARQLLYWAQVAVQGGPRGIVLASHGGADDGAGADGLEAWMKRLDKERSQLELGRVAYVAATRARRRLHLIGSATVTWTEEGMPALTVPRQGSLLAYLWPVVAPDFDRELDRARMADELRPAGTSSRPRGRAPVMRRLPSAYALPAVPASACDAPAGRKRAVEGTVRPHFDWAGREAIAVGTVVHAELERLARRRLPPAQLVVRPDDWRAELRRLGLPERLWDGATARISRAVSQISHSALAAKLLDPEARDAATELALTAWLDNEFTTIKVDRSFVDESGIRWIIDWKTGAHEGGGLERFLEQELERYAPQMQRYSRVMALHDPRPQKIGLYFPMMDAWQEWKPAG
jgi:ATP-dependent helicase/nuclease subunit A